MRKLALLVSLVMVFTLGGCSKGSQPKESALKETVANSDGVDVGEDKTVINIGLPFDPANLSPFSGLSPARIAINRTLYEYLIDRDGFGGDMVGCIMKDYEILDEVTYEMTIYDEIYDTAGNHVTADDVAWSYNYAKELGNLPKLSDIISIEVTGDYAVKFVFKELKAGDIETLWSECPIVTKAAFEASPDEMATTPIGTTAYKVTNFVPGSVLTLEDTENYWQKDVAASPRVAQHNVDIINYQIIPEASQLAIALETGTIDHSSFVGINDLDRFLNADGFVVSLNQRSLTDILYFNCHESNVFANEDLRKAIAYAIDSEAILQGAYKGQGIVSKTLGNSKFTDYNPVWDQEDYYNYDLDKAKEFLAVAGYAPGELNIKVLLGSGAEHKKDAEIIQAVLLGIGVNLEITAFDHTIFNTYKYDETQYDLLIDQAASTDYLVNVWKLGMDQTQYEGGTLNHARDEEMQVLLETVRKIDGHTQENVDAFHYHLKEKAYAIGLVSAKDNHVHTKVIKELVYDSRGFVLPGASIYNF